VSAKLSAPLGGLRRSHGRALAEADLLARVFVWSTPLMARIRALVSLAGVLEILSKVARCPGRLECGDGQTRAYGWESIYRNSASGLKFRVGNVTHCWA